MWAIIGGSGFEKFEEFKILKEIQLDTPFGAHSTSLKQVEWRGVSALFLSRHGKNHELLPHEINYRANIYALKTLGAKGILSFSAVGSLREELAPENMVFASQYIDYTKKRELSFCGNGSVAHYPFAHPVQNQVVKKVRQILSDVKFKTHYDKTYICIEGPRFSTVAESKMYQSWGADIIGMTNMPECYLAHEAGLLYLPFCFVTDYDCWKTDEEHVTIELVKKRMAKNLQHGKEILNLVINTKLYQEHPVANINSAIFSGPPVDWI